jgi:hypothetical protein
MLRIINNVWKNFRKMMFEDVDNVVNAQLGKVLKLFYKKQKKHTWQQNKKQNVK